MSDQSAARSSSTPPSPERCGSEADGDWAYRCSLSVGHPGPHVAHGMEGKHLYEWPASSPPPPSPPENPVEEIQRITREAVQKAYSASAADTERLTDELITASCHEAHLARIAKRQTLAARNALLTLYTRQREEIERQWAIDADGYDKQIASLSSQLKRLQADSREEVEDALELGSELNQLAVGLEDQVAALRAAFTDEDVEVLRAVLVVVGRESPTTGAEAYYSPRITSIADRIEAGLSSDSGTGGEK